MKLKPPRMPSKVAVDPRWSRPCVCALGENWRRLEDPPYKCPSCGGILKGGDNR